MAKHLKRNASDFFAEAELPPLRYKYESMTETLAGGELPV
jgi:hypothetical protein